MPRERHVCRWTVAHPHAQREVARAHLSAHTGALWRLDEDRARAVRPQAGAHHTTPHAIRDRQRAHDADGSAGSVRRQPVAFFLGDAAFLSDSKFRQLARRLTDADDFNSAVGAYFIALAAARRNGQPDLDLASETQSSFLPALIEVGLLVVEGFPDKAFGSWAPARPKYPSDTKVTSAPNAPSATDAPFTPASEPSLPLHSLPIPSSTGGGAGEGLPNLDATVAGIWERATGRSVIASGSRVAEYLDDVCRRHPPSEVGAAIIRSRKGFDHIPDGWALISGMRPLLDPFVDGKAVAKGDREAEDRAASRRRVEATHRANHKSGGHELAPRAGCPMCLEATA